MMADITAILTVLEERWPARSDEDVELALAFKEKRPLAGCFLVIDTILVYFLLGEAA
jgi:hypothetical protein